MKSLPTVVDCQGCGLCCLHMGYPAYIQGDGSRPAESNWLALPEPLKRDLLSYIGQYQPPAAGELDGPCCWLDEETRLCKHHQYRPDVCRKFDVGGKDCLDWRRFYQDKIVSGD